MMMDCQHARQLLPLWVGQDLPDAATANEVSEHLEQCRGCEQRRNGLLKSLEVLQGSSAETLSAEPHRSSLWPKLMTRISEWDNVKQRERFNGWIPASAMALAAALMVAVSIPSIQDEFFGGHSQSSATTDLIGSDFAFSLDAALKPDQSDNVSPGLRKTSKATPVVFKLEQW